MITFEWLSRLYIMSMVRMENKNLHQGSVSITLADQITLTSVCLVTLTNRVIQIRTIGNIKVTLCSRSLVSQMLSLRDCFIVRHPLGLRDSIFVTFPGILAWRWLR